MFRDKPRSRSEVQRPIASGRGPKLRKDYERNWYNKNVKLS